MSETFDVCFLTFDQTHLHPVVSCYLCIDVVLSMRLIWDFMQALDMMLWSPKSIALPVHSLEFHNSLEYRTPIDTPNAILDFQKVLQEFVQTKTLRRFGKSPFKFHQDQEVKSPFSSLLTTHPSPSNSDSIRWIRSSTSTDSSASTSPRWKAATKEATVWCGRAECNSSIAWLSFVEKHEQRIATILTQVVELVLISIYF